LHRLVRFTGDGVQPIRHSRLCPIEDIPHGVRVTAHSGQATDLPAGDPAGRRCCPAPPGAAAPSIAPVYLRLTLAHPGLAAWIAAMIRE
jgi:hypothetical protein